LLQQSGLGVVGVDFEVLGHGSIVQPRCCFPFNGVAGIPPRRAGNFLLLAQKKVTKEKSLNTDL